MVQDSARQAGQGLADSIRDIGARLRILEDRYTNLRKKTQLTDQSLLESQKSLSRDLRALTEDVMDVKRGLADLNDKIALLLGELGGAAKKADLIAVERYLDFWEPMEFVTRQRQETLNTGRG